MNGTRRPQARLPHPTPGTGANRSERLVDALGREVRIGAWVRLLSGQRERRGVVTAVTFERQEVHVRVQVDGESTDLLLAPDDMIVLNTGPTKDARGRPIAAGAAVLEHATGRAFYVNAIVSGGGAGPSVYVSDARGLYVGARHPADLLVREQA